MGIFAFLLIILKIIGIIILGILAVLLLIILTIILVSINYKVEVAKNEDLTIRFIVTWLFGIISINGGYKDGKAKSLVKIFGIGISGSNIGRKKRREKKRKRRPEGNAYANDKLSEPIPKPIADIKWQGEDSLVTNSETVEPDEDINDIVLQIASEDEPKNKGVRRIKMSSIETYEEPKMHEEPISKKTKEKNLNKESLLKKIISIFKKRKEEPDNSLGLGYFLDMPFEEKKKLIGSVIKFLKRVFRGISPDEIEIEAVMGTYDPALTGYIMGMYGVGKVYYGENINITADFKRTIADGEFKVRGKVTIVRFLFATIELISNKPVRKIIRLYLKGIGDKNG